MPDEPFITVNLGVGENLGQARARPLRGRAAAGAARKRALVVVDLGAGGDEEAARARRPSRVRGAPESQVRPWRGSFAALAAMIAASRLYVGYDSAASTPPRLAERRW